MWTTSCGATTPNIHSVAASVPDNASLSFVAASIGGSGIATYMPMTPSLLPTLICGIESREIMLPSISASGIDETASAIGRNTSKPATYTFGCNLHPARRKTLMRFAVNADPGSSIVGMVRTYCWPENTFNFSVITPICSPVRIRGAFNFFSASCASAAFWDASAARILYLRVNSSERLAPILAKATSPHTPATTINVAQNDPHRPQPDSWGGSKYAWPSSASNPTISSPAHLRAQRSNHSDSHSRSSSLALISPFFRRHAGKRAFGPSGKGWGLARSFCRLSAFFIGLRNENSNCFGLLVTGSS